MESPQVIITPINSKSEGRMLIKVLLSLTDFPLLHSPIKSFIIFIIHQISLRREPWKNNS